MDAVVNYDAPIPCRLKLGTDLKVILNLFHIIVQTWGIGRCIETSTLPRFVVIPPV